MQNRIVICPRKMGSEGASTLSTFFGTKKVFRDRRFRKRSSDLLINWGNSDNIPVFGETYLNKAEKVRLSSNKTETLRLLHENNVRVPGVATNQAEAARLFLDNQKVYCRTLTRASQGKGIVIANTFADIVSAPLYTQAVPNTNEYRVHIMNGEIIDVAEKRKLATAKLAEQGITINEEIKSHDNGWVFARGNARLKHLDGVYKNDIKVQSLRAMEVVGLDFGAVDIVYNNPTREATVLEINSAPGMEPGSTTSFSYINGFRKHMGLEPITYEEYNSFFSETDQLHEYELIKNFIENGN